MYKWRIISLFVVLFSLEANGQDFIGRRTDGSVFSGDRNDIDKFYRLKNSKTGGTGLGLSIVKGFVEAHQGIVVLENVPHGARFTIEIPAEVSYIKNLKNE